MKNSPDNLFDGVSVGKDEASHLARFLDDHDLAAASRKAVVSDLRKFAAWFAAANKEPFVLGRVTVRDVTDFREHLRREKGQAVATVNRCLVSVRRFLGWATEQGRLPANPATKAKQLRKQALAPKGLDRAVVRRLLREVELRQDVRASAVFSLFLYAGPRVSDVAGLELADLALGERSGTVTFRLGKGNKQRSAPLPLPARRALAAYLEVRPPMASSRVFVGDRNGPIRPCQNPLPKSGMAADAPGASLKAFHLGRYYGHMGRRRFLRAFLAFLEDRGLGRRTSTPARRLTSAELASWVNCGAVRRFDGRRD